MRTIININKDWLFFKEEVPLDKAFDGAGIRLDLPYTWNGEDGQDGKDDYFRGVCTFAHRFHAPASEKGGKVYLEFKGVNSSCRVYVNGELVTIHHGGYSTFRADITPFIGGEVELVVYVDNGKNERVYPQKADFTFYGGIYRDVNLITVGEYHFDLDNFGASGIAVTPSVKGENHIVRVDANANGGEIIVTIFDSEGKTVAFGNAGKELIVENAVLWDGVENPYLYTARAELICWGEVCDCLQTRFGFRTFSVDPERGFFLNGRSYPLNGVCRHQDRPKIGNALTTQMHEEDISIIREMGANALRLAHYQQDDYIYDLCDKAGIVVWAEIPYISRHMPQGNANAESQLRELILQLYNHPCIMFWGISNEITMTFGNRRDMLAEHIKLCDMAHAIDPSRLTTLACIGGCGVRNKVANITDAAAWNLYFGWYTPWLKLNDIWLYFARKFNPKRSIAYSEYGAEGMPNLHSAHPKRGDNSEEYQAIYHEYMLRCFSRHPRLWGTFVWNMFDFAADARDQGGDAGMNHKGLVTFDRKVRKDAFYVYKAYWSEEKFVCIAGKRYVNRAEKVSKVKVYTNCKEVRLYCNGKELHPSKVIDGHIFTYKIELAEENVLVAESGDCRDECVIHKVDKFDPSYKLRARSDMRSWQEKRQRNADKKITIL